MRKMVVDRGCTKCDSCRWLCPQQAITFDYEGAHINQQKCTGCGICVDNCASEAISTIEITEQEAEK